MRVLLIGSLVLYNSWSDGVRSDGMIIWVLRVLTQLPLKLINHSTIMYLCWRCHLFKVLITNERIVCITAHIWQVAVINASVQQVTVITAKWYQRLVMLPLQGSNCKWGKCHYFWAYMASCSDHISDWWCHLFKDQIANEGIVHTFVLMGLVAVITATLQWCSDHCCSDQFITDNWKLAFQFQLR